MGYPLADLLRIRRVREDRAERDLTARRKEVEAAERSLRQCQEELQAYRVWRLGEEDRLFEGVRERCIHLHDVEDLHLRITMLRLEELDKERRIAEAYARLREAREGLEGARATYRKAIQGRQKIEEHRRIWEALAQREAEHLAEKEMEEFIPQPHTEGGTWG